VLSRSPFKSRQAKRIGCFCIVFVTLCVKNVALMRAQHSVPLPDISHALRKQFLAGHHHSDALKGFHHWCLLRQNVSSDPQLTDVQLCCPGMTTELDKTGH